MTEDERRVAERRTMALRGPRAGGFTPPQSQAASNPCLNCGTNIQLTYCPECGQREIDSDPTLREFAHELAEEFLHWDGKVFRTFRLLVTRPGGLTREFLAGRRVRYISPLRVYLTCSVLFFFLAAVLPEPKRVLATGTAVNTQVGFGAAMRNRGELSAHVTASIPKAMFVLVPLFAALVMLVCRGSRRRFPQHLAFALHVHAVLFLTLTVMLARRLTSIIPVHVAIQLVCLGAFAVYLVRAMRATYGVSTGGAMARTALVASAYFVLFCGAMVLTFGLIVLLQF